MQTFCQLPRPLEIGKTLAQLLEKPLPNYWKSPRPTIGKTQLLATPTVENAQNFLLG